MRCADAAPPWRAEHGAATRCVRACWRPHGSGRRLDRARV